MKISGIYRIESIIKPERFYIGSGVNLQSRKRQHFSDLRLNKHGNNKLQNHYNKYGKEDLVFIIIEPCFPEFLIIREQYYLDKLKPWFNICLIAENCLGTKRTEEAKQKMRDAKLNLSDEIRRKYCIAQQNRTPEHNLNISKGKIGKKHSEETRRKMSESGGNRKGAKLSDETREKLSKALKGRVSPKKGKKVSEKEAERLRGLRKGVPSEKKGKPSPTKGSKLSEKARENIRLGWIKRKQNKELLCLLSQCRS